jgi:hypothetical protein
MVCGSGRVAIHACRGDLSRDAEPPGQQLVAIPCAVLSCVSDSLKTGAELPDANRRRELLCKSAGCVLARHVDRSSSAFGRDESEFNRDEA